MSNVMKSTPAKSTRFIMVTRTKSSKNKGNRKMALTRTRAAWLAAPVAGETLAAIGFRGRSSNVGLPLRSAPVLVVEPLATTQVAELVVAPALDVVAAHCLLHHALADLEHCRKCKLFWKKSI